MNYDSGAPGLGALVRLQELDQGQLWGGRQVVGPQGLRLSPECGWWGGQEGGRGLPYHVGEALP